MKIGLFFGSFNPMHIGHKIIASYMAEFSDLEKVLFVVSPENPLKQKKTLLDQAHRLQIIIAEVEDNPKLAVSDIEFSMPEPSYTIDTLVRLKEDYPENEYALIMGADNLQNLHEWKNYEQILENYSIYVYPRPGIEISRTHQNIHIVDDVPYMEISASFIRDSIKQGKDVSYLIPEKAWQYIDEMNFYKK
ncbi:MAG TPA: nicotinate-nucleotide adenylyltransferase [Flavobacteriales bacterium]|nr:nicotinate-nucleotide adenylyltransferase [Flavobacteriales bacterium]HIK62497.1 nicotinate-nucleotide adenylyltransferase [Flavobacteriales bacterium]